MTEIHEQAVNNAINFQAKKNGITQLQNGDVKISLTIASNELPVSFMQAPMGQIYTTVMVATDEDETPIQVVDKPKNGNVAQAVILCTQIRYQAYARQLNNKMFMETFNANEILADAAKVVMYEYLGIASRSEVSSGEAAIRFKRHVSQFNAWKRGE